MTVYDGCLSSRLSGMEAMYKLLSRNFLERRLIHITLVNIAAICGILSLIYQILNLSWLKPRDSWEFPTNVRIFTKLSPLSQRLLFIIY
nr:MAG TPA: hypothetical protein [Caudoviricetes sp.]